MVKRVAVFLTFLLGLVSIPGAALGAPLPAQLQDQSVRVEHLRVEVLSPTLLRLEYAANDSFEDRATFTAVDRSPSPTWFRASTRNGELRSTPPR